MLRKHSEDIPERVYHAGITIPIFTATGRLGLAKIHECCVMMNGRRVVGGEIISTTATQVKIEYK